MRSRLALVASVLLIACSTGQGSYEPAKVEPTLRLLLARRPDTVVSVLIRLRRDVQEEDSVFLGRSGFVTGSKAGRIITGYAAVAALRRLTAWPLLEWMEMSASVPPTPRRTRDSAVARETLQ
jgi:hypothetical protein